MFNERKKLFTVFTGVARRKLKFIIEFRVVYYLLCLSIMSITKIHKKEFNTLDSNRSGKSIKKAY